MCHAGVEQSLSATGRRITTLLSSIVPTPAEHARSTLACTGIVVLAGFVASPMLAVLHMYTAYLDFSRMYLLPGVQPDKLRRHVYLKHNLVGDRAMLAGVEELGRSVMQVTTGDAACPIYRPSVLATHPGAKPGYPHHDLSTPDSFSILVAIGARELPFHGLAMPVRLAPGDVLVFDARLCHTPAGRSASAPDIAFALHMYAGHGVDVKHLNSTLPCAAEIQ